MSRTRPGKDATLDINTLRAAARTAAGAFREAARSAFGSAKTSPARWETLALNGKLPAGTDFFLARAYALFDAALHDESIIAAVSTFGYTRDKLEAERRKVAEMDAANRAQEQAKGTRKGAVAQKTAAHDEMRRWMAAFKKMARRALASRDDLRTKLGI